MSGKLFKPEQPEIVVHSGDHYYQAIARLNSCQSIAASQGILLDIHIDPRIPVQVCMEAELVEETLVPLISQAIEHTPWSRLDIAFSLCNVIGSEFEVEMNIWGNGCRLRQYENIPYSVMQQNPIANSTSTDNGIPRTVRQQTGNYQLQHLAITRFKVQRNSERSFSWQVTGPSHEATLLLSNDQALGKRVETHLDRHHIITSHADSLTKACRTIVNNVDEMKYTTVLVDSRLGDKTLSKYASLLRDAASPGTRFILLTHNAINHSLIRKYHAAGYFAIVNLESKTELANAMYASAIFNATGSAGKKCSTPCAHTN